MSASVIDTVTPSGAAMWVWLVYFIVVGSVLFALVRVATPDSDYYEGTDAGSIAAAVGAVIVAIYALVSAIHFYDIRWPENDLWMGFFIPVVTALVAATMWFSRAPYGLGIVLAVAFSVLAASALLWWFTEIFEGISRAFAAAGGFGVVLVVGFILWALIER